MSQMHKEIINVKLMVKALEEVAEEEQKQLIKEEKEMADKLVLKIDEMKPSGISDVETPRSESADLKDSVSDEEKKQK